MGFVYLASPYGHPSARVREDRFYDAVKAAGNLMLKGHHVFAPIVHSHPIAENVLAIPNTHDFWLKQDFALLRYASTLVVLMLPGWQESVGVKAEIDRAGVLGIPIEYMEPV
jgi:hypothetical protein